MTTRVTVKHEGPYHHDVIVRVLDANTERQAVVIKPGQAEDFHVYGHRTIEIVEAIEDNDTPEPVAG